MSGTTLKLAWQPHSITIRAYCKCGGAIHATISPPGEILFVLESFAEQHQGDGCGPCDAKTSRKARRKRERIDHEYQRT